MAKRTSLASAIKTAGNYAIKDANSASSSESTRNYASSRIGMSMGTSVTTNMNRYSQMSGGTNTMTTAPNFIHHSLHHPRFKSLTLDVKFICGLTGGGIMNLKLLPL